MTSLTTNSGCHLWERDLACAWNGLQQLCAESHPIRIGCMHGRGPIYFLRRKTRPDFDPISPGPTAACAPSCGAGARQGIWPGNRVRSPPPLTLKRPKRPYSLSGLDGGIIVITPLRRRPSRPSQYAHPRPIFPNPIPRPADPRIRQRRASSWSGFCCGGTGFRKILIDVVLSRVLHSESQTFKSEAFPMRHGYARVSAFTAKRRPRRRLRAATPSSGCRSQVTLSW
jgi:hypothetical protein